MPRSVIVLSLMGALFSAPAMAQVEPGTEPRLTDHSTDEPEASPYRNPTGSISASGVAGLGIGDRTTLVLGVGVGYAVITGVLPGVRGLVIAGDGVGGEVAATLTLTPPLTGTFTPFVIGEVGRRWVPGTDAWMVGVGGGVYLGEPRASFNIQLGYIHRWFYFPSETIQLGSPLIGIAIRF